MPRHSVPEHATADASVLQLSRQDELSADQCTTCRHNPHLRGVGNWPARPTNLFPLLHARRLVRNQPNPNTTVGTCHTTAHTRIPHDGSRHSIIRLRHNTPRPDPHPYKESHAKTSACHASSPPTRPTQSTHGWHGKPRHQAPPGCTSAARSLSSWMLRRHHSSTGQRYAPLLLPPQTTQSSPSSP